MQIGIDVVTVDRMESVIAKHGERFLNRVFTEHEIEYCRRFRNPSACFAARFAAKEAFTKAIGTGITRGIRLKDIEVVRVPGNPPFYRLHGNAKKILKDRTAVLSITHEGTGIAVAVCLVY